jgi:hypothetical protein
LVIFHQPFAFSAFRLPPSAFRLPPSAFRLKFRAKISF